MTRQEAITILKQFNKWRRGGELEPHTPKNIGLAIDKAIEMMTEKKYHSDLTIEQENEIYDDYLVNGESQSYYAEKYDTTIYAIRKLIQSKIKKGAD